PLAIARAWLFQLASKWQGAFEIVKALSLKDVRSRSRKATEREVWSALSECLRALGPTYLAMDGFDEANYSPAKGKPSSLPERAGFLRDLFQNIKETHTRLLV